MEQGGSWTISKDVPLGGKNQNPREKVEMKGEEKKGRVRKRRERGDSEQCRRGKKRQKTPNFVERRKRLRPMSLSSRFTQTLVGPG